MKIIELNWEEDNNVMIFIEKDAIGITIKNVKHLIRWLNNRKSSQFYNVVSNNRTDVMINKDKITYAVFRDFKK